MAYITFDPSAKGALVTLSSGDLTATITQSDFIGNVRATEYNAEGSSLYAEFTLSTGAGPQTNYRPHIGIVNSDFPITDNTTELGTTSDGYVYFSTNAPGAVGQRVFNNTFEDYGDAFTDGDVISMLLESVSGEHVLTSIGSNSLGTSPYGIHISATGEFFYAANLQSDTITPEAIDPDTGDLSFSGAGLASTGANPYSVVGAVTGSGEFVYVVNGGDNSISMFSVNPSTGALTNVAADLVTSGSTAYDIIVNPDNETLYVTHNLDNTITQYDINQSTGELTAVGSSVATGSNPREMAIAEVSGGKFLYALNNGSATISAFSVNAVSGSLASLGSAVATGADPRDIIVDPGNAFVYVANYGGASISTYSIHQTTGALTLVSTTGTDSALSPSRLAAAPAGGFIYATCVGPNTLQVYSVDGGTGEPTFVSDVYLGVAAASGIAVYPTGAFVYTTLAAGDSVSYWRVNSYTYTLSFWKNGVDQGEAYSGITGSWAPAYGSQYNSTVVTANFGDSAWAYSPPSGFVGWDDYQNDITVDVESPAPTLVTGTDGVVASAAVPTLVIGDTGIVISAPTARLVIGPNGAAVSAPAPTLVATVAFEGLAISAPAPTLSCTVATGEIGGVSGTAPAPTLAAAGTAAPTGVVDGTAPVPTLAATAIPGTAITFSGTAPRPRIGFGFKTAVLSAPAPTLVATATAGRVITVTARAAAPILSAVAENPALITAAGTAALPRLSAALAAGQIATAVLEARVPRLSATAFAGNVITVLAEAATPIMSAAGYPAYTITFAGTAPVPYTTATMSAAIASAYRTWVLNTRKGALTEYGSEWAFNSYTVFNGVVLAAGPSGIVELGTQDQDNTTAIDSTVKSGKDNFGNSHIKRLPRLYVDYSTDGGAQFKTITTEGGSRTYALDWNGISGVQQRRVPIGKGPKSVRWQWEYTNVSGADFDLGAVMAYPTVSRRRVQ
jgi:6-phosphogluconolactonase (cycloisomerase 2 family)